MNEYEEQNILSQSDDVTKIFDVVIRVGFSPKLFISFDERTSAKPKT